MLLLTATLAHAQAPIAAALDAAGERIVIHEPDGALPVFRRSDGARLLTLDGPRGIEALAWKGETLVGTGPDGTFVWDTRTGALLHGYAPSAVVAVSDDGRYLATGRLLVRIGDPVPLATWPEADAVAFSADGAHVATRHGVDTVLHALPQEPPPRRRSLGRRAAMD